MSRTRGRVGESFLSPTIQREAIDRLAAAKGLELGEVVEELDVSGGTRIDDRALGRLVRKVEQGQSAGILVWKVSRFSRDLLDAVTVADRIRQAGGLLLGDDLDTSQQMGKALLGFLAGWAEEERDQRRAVWATSQERAVARGVHIASRTPTGYRRRDDGRLEPDPAAVGVIRELFRRRSSGAGWTELARFLDESGIRGPYPEQKAWTGAAAAKMVRNPVYLGEARSGRYVNPDAHEPLVTRAEWEAAQGDGRYISRPRSGDGLLLSGLVRCAGCRFLMKPDHMRGRNGERLGIYRCRRRHAAGECPAPATVMARLLDPWLEETFLAALEDGGPLAEASEASAAVEASLRRVQDAEAELDAYLAAGVAAIVGVDRYQAGLGERQRTLDAARAELADARRASVLPDTIPADAALVDAWATLTVPERRHLLAASLDAIIVRAVRGNRSPVPVDGRALVLWRGEAPDDLPRRGRRQPLSSFPWPSNKRPANVRVAGR